MRGPTSPMMLVYSFFVVALIGALLLYLPISSTEPGFMSPTGALFTSISAMTGTGLIVVDTAQAWTGFGKVVIAILLLIGGLGFMTGAAFLLLITGRRSSLQGRLVVGAGLDDNRLGTIASLARNIILMAIIVQIIGAVLIFIRWYLVTPIWPGITMVEGLWQSVFTSISAFNNAGFEILPDGLVGGESLSGLTRDVPSLIIIGAMILIGSSSYATLSNLIEIRGHRFRGLLSKTILIGFGLLTALGIGAAITVIGISRDIEGLEILGEVILTATVGWAIIFYVLKFRKWALLSLDTKLVLIGIGLMLVIGLTSFLSLEWSNPNTIGNEPAVSKVTQGLFHTVNRTAGFSSVDYSQLHPANTSVTEGLMFVGGVSASTAGGIKVSTLMVIIIASFAIFSGKERTTIFGREIPRVNVQRAMAVAATATLALLVLVVSLFIVQPDLEFRTAIFEVISAFGTVGWSAGTTPHLNEAAQVVISIAMFTGRFGPITITLFMAGRERQDTIRYAGERIRIG